MTNDHVGAASPNNGVSLARVVSTSTRSLTLSLPLLHLPDRSADATLSRPKWRVRVGAVDKPSRSAVRGETAADDDP